MFLVFGAIALMLPKDPNDLPGVLIALFCPSFIRRAWPFLKECQAALRASKLAATCLGKRLPLFSLALARRI